MRAGPAPAKTRGMPQVLTAALRRSCRAFHARRRDGGRLLGGSRLLEFSLQPAFCLGAPFFLASVFLLSFGETGTGASSHCHLQCATCLCRRFVGRCCALMPLRTCGIRAGYASNGLAGCRVLAVWIRKEPARGVSRRKDAKEDISSIRHGATQRRSNSTPARRCSTAARLLFTLRRQLDRCLRFWPSLLKDADNLGSLLPPADQLFHFPLADHLDAQLARLVELRPGFVSGDHVVGFLAD